MRLDPTVQFWTIKGKQWKMLKPSIELTADHDNSLLACHFQ